MRKLMFVAVAAATLLPLAAYAQLATDGLTLAVPANNGLGLSTFLAPVVAGVGTVFAGILTFLANKALNALTARLGVQATESQKDSIRGAIQTASGLLQMELTKGTLTLDQMHIGNPQVRLLIQAAMSAVPAAMASLGVTPETFTNMALGGLGKALGQDPTVPGVAPALPAPAPVPGAAPLAVPSSAPVASAPEGPAAA